MEERYIPLILAFYRFEFGILNFLYRIFIKDKNKVSYVFSRIGVLEFEKL